MKVFISILLTLTSFSAFAGDYKAPITRQGVTTVRSVYNFWSGEWPGPIIEVHNPDKSGMTTITALKSVRDDQAEQVQCTIIDGSIHPWAKNYGSILDFYTLTALNEYEANNDITATWMDTPFSPISGTAPVIAKGTIINVVYGSEGYCTATVNAEIVSFPCDEIMNKATDFKRLSPEGDDFYEQWVYLQCNEGYTAFVQDENLLTQQNVTTGDICGFGQLKVFGQTCPQQPAN